jgi:hypothetical protein
MALLRLAINLIPFKVKPPHLPLFPMLRLIQILIFGHIHKWKIIKEYDLIWDENSKVPHGKMVYLQCIDCGTVTHKNLTCY